MTIVKLNQSSINLATDFCTGKIKEFSDPVLANFILSYLDDSNSSTLREAVTANICKYKWLNEKLGYDAVDEVTQEYKEIKPKRYTKGRFDGSGNFSDLTPERILKFKETEKETGMISSFFIHGRLGYVIEFGLSDILDHIASQVHKKCIVEKNRYARSSRYTFKNWINSPKIKIHYIDLPLLKEKNCIHKEFIGLLEKLCD
jgi:hypothetical protein